MVFALLAAKPAFAGGLYFSERGVVPLARGGAFVAGADDINAMWFNPAGLTFAQSTLLADASVMIFGADYQRTAQVVGPGGALETLAFQSVHGDTPPVAIPTIGMAFPVGADHRLTVGGGVFAPYSPLLRWPETLSDGSPSPSRYSLISLEGSLLGIVDLFAAYKLTEELRVGAGLELLVGTFQDVVDLNANPGVAGPPQDPSWDALSETRATIVTPSGNLGVTWIPSKIVRFGLAGQLPFWVDAPATVSVRLPSASLFTNASQVGDNAGVKFRLPAHLRAGVELRPAENVRIELSYEHQFWSLHDTIDITPHDIQLMGVAGFPSPVTVPRISIPRHFQDCDSVHLGGEITVPTSATMKVHIRAGLAFESSAVPNQYESPLTVDGDKLTFAGGLGLTIDRTRLDATFAYVYMFDVDVPPGQAQLNAINPLPGNPPPINAVNGGHYSAGAPIIGLGFQYKFGAAAPPSKPKPKEQEPPLLETVLEEPVKKPPTRHHHVVPAPD